MDGKNRGTTTVVGLCSISMLKNIFRTVTLYMCLGSMIACAQTQPGASAAPKLETDDQKTLYALGLLLGSNVKPFALTPDELAIVKAGLTDGVTGGKPQVELDQYGPKVKELAQKRAAAGAEEAKKRDKNSRTTSRSRRTLRKPPRDSSFEPLQKVPAQIHPRLTW